MTFLHTISHYIYYYLSPEKRLKLSVHVSQSSFFNLSHTNISMRILHSTQVSVENTSHKLQWL